MRSALEMANIFLFYGILKTFNGVNTLYDVRHGGDDDNNSNNIDDGERREHCVKWSMALAKTNNEWSGEKKTKRVL